MQHGNSDVESQRRLCFIEPNSRKLLQDLSYAYDNANAGDDWEDVRERLRPFIEVENNGVGPQRALMIGWQIDKTLVVVDTLIATLLSVGAGFLVGELRHDAALGVGVATGFGTFLAFLAFVLAKLFR
jgi:hypothetical protein